MYHGYRRISKVEGKILGSRPTATENSIDFNYTIEELFE